MPTGQKFPIVLGPFEDSFKDSIVNSWANFIVTGRPKEDWPLYNETTDINWDLDLLQKSVTGLEKDSCDFIATIDLLQPQ